MVSEDFKIEGRLDFSQPKQQVADLQISMSRVVSTWTRIRRTIKREIYNISSVVLSTVSIVRAVAMATGQVLSPIQSALLTSISATMSTIIGIHAALAAGTLGVTAGASIMLATYALAITLAIQAQVIMGMEEADAKMMAAISAVDSTANLAMALSRLGD